MRRAIPEALRIAEGGGVPVVVRVNDEFSDLIRDLDACVRPELDEVVLPKVETPDQVKVLEALLAERESRAPGVCGSGLDRHRWSVSRRLPGSLVRLVRPREVAFSSGVSLGP